MRIVVLREVTYEGEVDAELLAEADGDVGALLNEITPQEMGLQAIEDEITGWTELK